MRELVANIGWLKSFIPQLSDAPPVADWAWWCQAALRPVWKGWLRAALAKDRARLAVAALAPQPPPAPRNCTRICYECGAAFLDRRALLAHCFRNHGRKHPMVPMVWATSCICCGFEFHARSRILRHLTDSGCSGKLLASGLPPAPPEVDALLALAENCTGPLQTTPAFRLPGPRPLWAARTARSHPDGGT